MNVQIDFSVIIPHRDSIGSLPKLFSSIPISDNIEILLVDNSLTPISRADINTDRKYSLLYSDPIRGAGGARNIGIENARGKWFIFADSDDYFEKNAFDYFYSNIDASADIIYYCLRGVVLETGLYSTRGSATTNLVKNYLSNPKNELILRVRNFSPCGKMIKSSLIHKLNARYDEVIAGNDAYFSLVIGLNSKEIQASGQVVYVVTESASSLTARQDFDVIKSRYQTTLKCNNYLKQHNLGFLQSPVTFYLKESFKFGPKSVFVFLYLLCKAKQNPFTGILNKLTHMYHGINKA